MVSGTAYPRDGRRARPDPEQLARLSSAVGFKLGGGTPAARALSLTAELQAVLSRSQGVHLRQHSGPIHASEQAEPEAEHRKSA